MWIFQTTTKSGDKRRTHVWLSLWARKRCGLFAPSKKRLLRSWLKVYVKHVVVKEKDHVWIWLRCRLRLRTTLYLDVFMDGSVMIELVVVVVVVAVAALEFSEERLWDYYLLSAWVISSLSWVGLILSLA